jgi:flagellar assembly factor FliW
VNVKTTRFGEIEVRDADRVEFPLGLIGFPELKSYVLLDFVGDARCKWLQSLDDGSVAFLVVNPLLLSPDYVAEVNEAEVACLDLADEADAVLATILTVPSDRRRATANFKAPVVFNLKTRRGAQVILGGAEFTTRHRIPDFFAPEVSK